MELYDERAIAKLLNCKVKTLQAWRTRGGGPVFVRIGRLVRYKREDVTTWVESRRMRSTSDIRDKTSGDGSFSDASSLKSTDKRTNSS